MQGWYIYILSNNSHTLYVGMTSDLPRRFFEHKIGFYRTARYTWDRIVYFEVVATRDEALARERRIKAWSRKKKVALIQSVNANWIDLSATWPKALKIE